MRLLKIVFSLAFVLGIWLPSSAQNGSISDLQSRLDQLALDADSLTYSKNQNQRLETAQLLYDSLNEILSNETSFKLNYDSFKTISILTSEDQRIRLFTWNYFNDTGFYTVYGILQLNPKYYDEFMFPLSSSLTPIDTNYQELNTDQWLPALYYGIYTYQYKRKCYYLLTGFNGSTPYLDQRIVDVIKINKQDEPMFGSPIFVGKNKNRFAKSRLVFKYSSQASMVCRVEKEEKRLVVSSLVPVRWQKKGNYEYYTPDGTYDYYQYKKGKWIFEELLDDFGRIGNKELKGKFKTE